MNDDFNDFGFTAVTEDDLQAVETSKTQVEELQQQLDSVDKRASMLYNAIIPLLDNLRKNPEKEYIYWPDRVSKIDAFETKLSNIVNGDET
jgi:hypothetical protein